MHFVINLILFLHYFCVFDILSEILNAKLIKFSSKLHENFKQILIFHTLKIDPRGRPAEIVVIAIFTRGVRLSVPTFQNLAKQNNFHSTNSDPY